MPQTTFDDLKKRQTLNQLTDKQKRIIRLLATGQTQSLIAKTMRVSRSSVNQFTSFLEENNLVKREINKNYNIIYSVSPELQKRLGENHEPVMICRVHSIAMKFSIIKQDHPISKDKRTGYTHSWKLRGWEPSAFWFPGKAGEIACTVTTTPKKIVIRMDAKQKIIGKDEMDATHKGYQHLIYVRQQFIEKQRLFGVNLEIEPTGQIVGKAHYGYPIPENHPVAKELMEGRVPGWRADRSLDELGASGVIEGETEIQSQATIMGRTLNLTNTLPDMIRSAIIPEAMKEFERTFAPLTSEIHMVMAHIQSGQSVQNQINQLVVLVAQLVKDNRDLKKKLEERGI